MMISSASRKDICLSLIRAILEIVHSEDERVTVDNVNQIGELCSKLSMAIDAGIKGQEVR